MSKIEHFAVLIRGGGQGGKLLAWNPGRAGRSVALVEHEWVGRLAQQSGAFLARTKFGAHGWCIWSAARRISR
jgi:hypothetical protein